MEKDLQKSRVGYLVIDLWREWREGQRSRNLMKIALSVSRVSSCFR